MCKYMRNIWKIIFQAMNRDNPLGVELGDKEKLFYSIFFYVFKLFTFN